jgi:hypothetical protein
MLSLLLIAGWFLLSTRNHVGGGPNKTSGIIYRLRLIDGAKGQWGLEHHQTGAALPTKEDLIPYLGGIFKTDADADAWMKPVAGEHYNIKTLAEVPEAELTHDLEGRPKGTVIRLANNWADQFLYPTNRTNR